MNEFLMVRSSHKRRHTRSTKIVRQAFQHHQATSKVPTQPNFNQTRVVRDTNNSAHGTTTCINDPSYNAIETKTEIPKRNDSTNSQLPDAHRAFNPEDPLSVIYGEILNTLKIHNVI